MDKKQDINGPVDQAVMCVRCNVRMTTGIAIQNTLVGIPDFIGSSDVITYSYGGSGKLIGVLKCTGCGHSIST